MTTRLVGNEITKNEYLSVIERIRTMRYYNIRRTGCIVCRLCKKKSNTPTLHLDHVAAKHSDMRRQCPYCFSVQVVQADRRTPKRATQHMKLCCFLHKVENIQYRQLFNDMKTVETAAVVATTTTTTDEDDLSGDLDLLRTTMLTIQPTVNTSRYLMNVVEYELNNCKQQQHVAVASESSSSSSTTPERQLCQQNTLTGTTTTKFLKTIDEFHKQFCLRVDYEDGEGGGGGGEANMPPPWFSINLSEISCTIDMLVARNKLKFHETENISCQMIRTLSVHWHKFNIFKYTIKLDAFLQNIELFKTYLTERYFLITPYMCITSLTPPPSSPHQSSRSLALTMIIVGNRNNCSYYWNNVIGLAIQLHEIENIDVLIDTCFNVSNSGDDLFRFFKSETYNIMGIDFNEDVLTSAAATAHHNRCNATIKLHTTIGEGSVSSPPPQSPPLHIFCPVGKNAKVYFYSQTKYGCVRAFDRLLFRCNLANHITNVIFDGKTYFIYYASFIDDPTFSAPQFQINLRNGETFLDENSYSARWYDAKYLDMKNLFFINAYNVKVVGGGGGGATSSPEKTYFPAFLYWTNLRYFLTTSQIMIYKVVQYHREKLLINMNNIPQIDL